MEKKTFLLSTLIIGILIGLVIGVFFRPYVSLEVISADKVYIEELTGAGFGSDGELKNAYWVVTLTVDVKQSHFFILDKDFTYVKSINDTFEGKTVRPYSVINITFIPEEPYYAVLLDKIEPYTIVPKEYDVINGHTNTSYEHPALTSDGIYVLPDNPSWDLYTPFWVIIEKNGKEISRQEIVAIGNVQKQWYLVGDESSSDKARIDVIGKLTTGYDKPNPEKFALFSTVDKTLKYVVECKDGVLRTIATMTQFKSKTISTTWFPNVEVPDYDNMPADYSYFRYWVGGDASATSGVVDSAYMKYHWFKDGGYVGGLDAGNPAIGHNRPPLGFYSDYNKYFVDYGFCNKYPAWTAIDKYVDWLGREYWENAVYNVPSLTVDNPGTTPTVGKSVYSWLIDSGATYIDVKGKHGTHLSWEPNELKVYYPTGSAYDIVTLRISTELADTYAYGEYMAQFDILENESGWKSNGSLSGVSLIQKIPEDLIIKVKNVGNVSANAQLRIKPISPTNFFQIVSVTATSITSNNPIEPNNVYNFTISFENTGATVTFDFEIEISVWCEANQQDLVHATGNVLESSCTLTIYTVGDNYKAKIYINGVETSRNKGTYYQAVVPKGIYKIEFENLEGLNIPIIIVDNVQVGQGWTVVSLNPGDNKKVVATYISTQTDLLTGFVSWSDKGIFGFSPSYNPVATTRPIIPEWHVVKLIVNVTAVGTVEGNLTITIFADEEVPVYYTSKSYSLTLGSGATKLLDLDFMLGNSKGYYYQVSFNNAVIYADPSSDTRPEVFITPWYIAYGLYISLGVIGIIALAAVFYYIKWKATVRY